MGAVRHDLVYQVLKVVRVPLCSFSKMLDGSPLTAISILAEIVGLAKVLRLHLIL